MGLVLGGKNLPPFFLGLHGLKRSLSLHAEDLFDEIFFSLFDIVFSLPEAFLSPLHFFLHFLPGFSGLDVSDHAVEVPEERFRMVIDITFFLSVNPKIVGLFKSGFV